LIAVTIVWIKQAIPATVKLYIVMGHDMNRTTEAARLFLRERQVQFIDQLPTLHVMLRNRGILLLIWKNSPALRQMTGQFPGR
jgi:hypothetical protein